VILGAIAVIVLVTLVGLDAWGVPDRMSIGDQLRIMALWLQTVWGIAGLGLAVVGHFRLACLRRLG